MNEHELDRAIDRAAGDLVAGEPSRALTYKVMARVRKGDAPTPRRFVWAMAAASLVLSVAIATSLVNRATPVAFPAAPPARVPAFGPSLVAVSPIAVVDETTERFDHPIGSRAAATAASLPLPFVDIPIDPIETASITVPAIDVPQLEREATAINTLTVEPLTIEPLAASND